MRNVFKCNVMNHRTEILPEKNVMLSLVTQKDSCQARQLKQNTFGGVLVQAGAT